MVLEEWRVGRGDDTPAVGPAPCVCCWLVMREHEGKIHRETRMGSNLSPFLPVSASGSLQCVFTYGNLENHWPTFQGISLLLQETEMLNYNNILNLRDAF